MSVQILRLTTQQLWVALGRSVFHVCHRYNIRLKLCHSDETVTGMEGYVGIDTVQSNIVVALRGSGSVRNWIADVNIFLSSCSDLVEDCKVHAGFKKAWDNIADETISLVRSARDANPDYQIVVTGHSLGAGVANIAAAYLRVNGLPCDLYTYGSPRAGNEQFASFVSGQAEGNEYRITHTDDPFTRLPPNSWILGSYRHVTPEYWLTQVNGSADALVSDITVCEGTNNDDCNSGTDGFDTLAHLWYFGGIAGCAPASITL